MASKKVPDLYFIGELVDVTAQLGGLQFSMGLGLWLCGEAGGVIDIDERVCWRHLS